MNKTSKVLVTLICLFAMSTVGFVNATPRPLKEANMVYWTSIDPKELPVPGNQVSDFKLRLDPAVEWYYLGVKFVKPTYPEAWYMFFLESPDDPAFWQYWASKGVDGSPSMQPWQVLMWRIISDTVPKAQRMPMFDLWSYGDGTYFLMDSLTRIAFHEYVPLRVNGDYPKGTYTFVCAFAIGPSGPIMPNPLAGVAMTIEFR